MERIAYTVDEVIEIVGIGKTKLYEAIGSGELPSKKIGRRRLILASELKAWLTGLPSIS